MPRLFFGIALTATFLTLTHAVLATPTEAVINSFSGGATGSQALGGLVSDARGNLYGMLQYGGHNNGGLVYRLRPLNAEKSNWQFSIIYLFGLKAQDGAYPWGNLILDQSGNLYGTTAFGGHCPLYTVGCGTVFKLSPPPSGKVLWTETVLHRFASQLDGVEPLTGLVRDKAGHLYGSTSQGGTGNHGTVFELSPPTGSQTAWTKQTIFSFWNAAAFGSGPDSPLLLDTTGALYGTTPQNAVVFKLTPTGGQEWRETILYKFNSFAPGEQPEGGVIAGMNGVLYGTTYVRGNCQTYEFGCGQVFSLTPSGNGKPWTFNSLYSFQAGADGSFPTGRLIIDATGALYGTTSAACGFYGNDASTAFKLVPPITGATNWTFTTLHRFGAVGDGNCPAAGLIADAVGNLFGTTPIGGTNQSGTAYIISGAGFVSSGK